MKRNIAFLLFFLISCMNHAKVIKSENITSVKAVFFANDSMKVYDTIVQESKIIKRIVDEINSASPELIKFFAVDNLIISYDDGKQEKVLYNGRSIKYNGKTYKTNKGINSLLKN